MILDINPEVYRLGYGDVTGLEQLKKYADDHGFEIRHQPGVRIGLLISDDNILIYSPTPLLIEAGSQQPEKPNAILLKEISLSQVEKACGSSDLFIQGSSEIGSTIVNPILIEGVKKDLTENPPKRFDIARAERVFNSRIQYVEFSLESYRISQKVAPIPPDLMGLTNIQELQNRWRNTFKLFDTGKSFNVHIPDFDEKGEMVKNKDSTCKMTQYNEKNLEEEKKQIIKDYLYVLPNFGTVLLRARRSGFEERIERFKKRIEAYRKAVEGAIESELEKSVKNLVNAILPRVKDNPPTRYRKGILGNNLTDDELGNLLYDDLKDIFGDIKNVFDPKIKLVFKDVSYETIHDQKFCEALRRVMPARTVEKLFSEYNAAPEQTRQE